MAATVPSEYIHPTEVPRIWHELVASGGSAGKYHVVPRSLLNASLGTLLVALPLAMIAHSCPRDANDRILHPMWATCDHEPVPVADFQNVVEPEPAVVTSQKHPSVAEYPAPIGASPPLSVGKLCCVHVWPSVVDA